MRFFGRIIAGIIALLILFPSVNLIDNLAGVKYFVEGSGDQKLQAVQQGEEEPGGILVYRDGVAGINLSRISKLNPRVQISNFLFLLLGFFFKLYVRR